MPELVESIKNPELGVRIFALQFLGFLGASAREAVPAITNALKDDDPYVRKTAAAAIMQIAPEAAAKAGVK
jgi:HEAT repeat protein